MTDAAFDPIDIVADADLPDGPAMSAKAPSNERRCLVTRSVLDRDQLIRFVVDPVKCRQAGVFQDPGDVFIGEKHELFDQLMTQLLWIRRQVQVQTSRRLSRGT